LVLAMKLLNHWYCNFLKSLMMSVLIAIPVAASGFEVPARTAIPIIFSHTLDSRKAKVGDAVNAKTTQVVTLPSGEEIPKNSSVLGHVIASEGIAHGTSASKLAVRFDSIIVKKQSIPVRVFVRVLASPNESYAAMGPTPYVGSDYLETTTLIGGDYFYLVDKHLYAPNGKVVGESRGNGVFARLASSACSERGGGDCCAGTDTVQSLGIYSPSACGLYGFGDTEMTAAGDADPSGIFTLESSDSFVRIWGRSTALLQVVGHI